MLHRIPAPRPWTSRFAWLHPKAYLAIHIVIGLLLAAACGWLFYEIADSLTGGGRLVAADHAVATWVETHNTERGETLALGISLLGNQVLWPLLALIGIGYIIRREWPRVTLLAVSSIGGVLLNLVLKDRFQRARPIFAQEFNVDGTSFPSGHAMAAFIGWGVLAYLVAAHVRHARARRMIFACAGLLILLIGLTRIYLDVHFMSDVAAGFLAGGVWLFVCISAFRFAHLKRLGE